jgi:hypothetical protein
VNTPVRSLRIPDELWDWLKKRGDALGTNRSHILVSTLSEMARHDIAPDKLHQLITAAAEEDDNG